MNFMQRAPEATEFGKITQNKGHCIVQGHSASPILVPIKSSYDFLLVINTNFFAYLAPFPRDSLRGSKSLYLATPLAFNPPPRRDSRGTISVKFSVDVN